MLLYPLMSVAAAGARLPHVLSSTATARCSAARGGWRSRSTACLFGFGHIVVGTELAVVGTMATGMLFALRYALTRSFWAVFLEHTLWGALVFTVGLGRFFFTGVGISSWR